MSEVADEGLLLVDKPEGPTSHDVVARVRRVLGQRRVGHTGTLDPMASGVLALVLGRATRLARFLPGEPKTYTGTLRLGITTDTDDTTGSERTLHDGPLPSPEEVVAQAGRLEGPQQQVPPAVSARKVDGVRMYRLARKGRPVRAEPRPVQVFRFRLEPTGDPALWDFVVSVSAGTYVRALARDLGEALGCGGALAALRRTAIGPLGIAQAAPLEPWPVLSAEALRAALVPLDTLPLALPTVRLGSDADLLRFLHGGVVPTSEQIAGQARVEGPDGGFAGVGEIVSGALHPRVVLS